MLRQTGHVKEVLRSSISFLRRSFPESCVETAFRFIVSLSVGRVLRGNAELIDETKEGKNAHRKRLRE